MRRSPQETDLCTERPALLQLRLLQQLAAGPGHTVVVGNPPFGTQR